VRHPGPHDRLSFPFFFDPGFFSRVQPIDIPGRAAPTGEAATRWDRENVHAFEGTYGDYVLRKVSRVFPELQQDVLDAAALRRTPEA
jgi:polar amino acid transport system ATP-binding protein